MGTVRGRKARSLGGPRDDRGTECGSTDSPRTVRAPAGGCAEGETPRGTSKRQGGERGRGKGRWFDTVLRGLGPAHHERIGGRPCGLPGRGRSETGPYTRLGSGCRSGRGGRVRQGSWLLLGPGRGRRDDGEATEELAGHLWSGRAWDWVTAVDLMVMAARRSGTGSGRPSVRGLKVRLSVSSRAGSARSCT